MNARTTRRTSRSEQRLRPRHERFALGAEVVGARVGRAQRLGARAVLLDEGEPRAALPLREHVAEEPPEQVDVAGERLVHFRTF